MSKQKTKWFLAVFLVSAILFTANSCKKDDVDPPTVTTADVTQITSAGAISGGTVMSDGGADIEARGVVWSTSQNPTISDNKTNESPE
jgi:hypothetical protein